MQVGDLVTHSKRLSRVCVGVLVWNAMQVACRLEWAWAK